MAVRVNRVHKWISVVVGVALVAWVVSGVVMILPGGGPPVVPAPPAAYEEVTLSPAQVARLLAERDGVGRPIRSMQLTSLLDRSVYRVETPGGPYLVDGRTGERVAVSAEVAAETVRRLHPGAEPAGAPELVSRHDRLEYPRGPLPAYRVGLADGRGTVLFVSRDDGTVTRTSRARQVRNLIHGLHTFSPVETLFGQRARKGSLYLASLATMGVIATGYWLALARGRRRPTVGRGPAPRVPALVEPE